MCAGFAVAACQMPHGPAQSTAFRFEADGKAIGYATDFSAITGEMVALFDRSDVLVIDCLRRDPHPTHAHLERTLEWIARLKPRRAILTNLHIDLDFETLRKELPTGVEPGYDGLRFEHQISDQFT